MCGRPFINFIRNVGKLPTKPTSNVVMEELDYCRQVVDVVETQSKVAQNPAMKEILYVLKEVLKVDTLLIGGNADEEFHARTSKKDSTNLPGLYLRVGGERSDTIYRIPLPF